MAKYVDPSARGAPAAAATAPAAAQWLPSSSLVLPRMLVAQPQWSDPDKETLTQDPVFKNFSCATCGKLKEQCVCLKCWVCAAAVGRFTRHHCRKCWKPTCAKCRDRQRYTNPFAGMAERTKQPVCDPCAVYKGLARTSDATEYTGLYLLRASMQFPRECVNVNGCGNFTYGPTCMACGLPSVPAAPHDERLVRVVYCCSWANRCQRCATADQRMAAFEQFNESRRMGQFQALDDAAVEQAFSRVKTLLPNMDALQTREVLMALVAASVCYEYDSFPHTTLALSDVPCASLLRIKECRQQYSLIEGPNRTMFIAFPGTHDMRTIITDVKFQRVREFEHDAHNGGILGGPTGGGRTLHNGVIKLWQYKIHAGFYAEHKKLNTAVPSTLCKALVLQGYKLVITGHSLGGALAVLTTLRLLIQDIALFKDSIKCIAFGSPLVGDTDFAHRIQRCGWERHFVHFVNRTDIVPRLLTERQAHVFAVQNLKETMNSRVQKVSEWFGSFKKTKDPAAAGSESVTAGATAGSTGATSDAAPSSLSRSERASPPPGTTVDPDDVDAPEDDDTAPSSLATSSALGASAAVGHDTSRRSFDTVGSYYFLNRTADRVVITRGGSVARLTPAPTGAAIPAGAAAAETAASSASNAAPERVFLAPTRHDAFALIKYGVPGAKIDLGDHLLNAYNKSLTVAVSGILAHVC